jgi:exodeoxyribonuclease VII large subunit
VQGQEAEASILASLSNIRLKMAHYDAVAIIRGGGSQLDLSCFDSYKLAVEIAKFPIPVITGIGHERDDTVADIVAHTKLKTPTAVAEFLLSGMRDFEERLLYARRTVLQLATGMIKDESHRLRYLARTAQHLLTRKFHDEHSRLHTAVSGLRQAVGGTIHVNTNRLSLDAERLGANVRTFIQSRENKVKQLEQAVRLLDPVNVLKRGYSITFHKNKAVKNAEGIKEGDIIITKLYDGSIKSTVEEKDGK